MDRSNKKRTSYESSESAFLLWKERYAVDSDAMELQNNRNNKVAAEKQQKTTAVWQV